MADYSRLRPLPPSVFQRMRAALAAARQPLVAPTSEERARQLADMGQELDAHGSPIPIGLTPAEQQAALDPGLGGPPLEVDVDPKPGWKTSEFWLHALVTLIVIPVLAWLANQAVSPLGDILQSLGSGNAILAAVVLAMKPVLFGFLAWAVAQLQAKYADSRAAVKIAHLKARTEG
jgi:Ca2+/H+ antiporter